MYSYDDVAFGVVKSLDTRKINASLRCLHANDRELFPAHDYAPKIWENRWFNNETIVGYPAGYCVWKNVYNDVSSFLDVYGDLVYKYAQDNSLLQNVIISSWEEVKNAYVNQAGVPTAAYDIWKDRYYNAISGYSKTTQTDLTKNSQITYLKLEVTETSPTGNPTFVEIEDIELLGTSKFSFADHRPILAAINAKATSGELSNIIDGNPRSGCVLQTVDGRTVTDKNPLVVIIQLFRDFLDLKTYHSWKVTFKDGRYATKFNLYCSDDGEKWAYLAQVTNGQQTNSDKVRLRNTSYRKQYLPMMFDYGPYSVDDNIIPISEKSDPKYTQVSCVDGALLLKDIDGLLTRKALMLDDRLKKIELYISKVDDNKSYLSDETAWRNLILPDEGSLSAFISAEIDTIFNAHMKNYHLDGALSKDEVEQVLLRNDLSNFSLDAVQSKIEVKAHDQFLNSDGFDYVVDYKRTPTAVTIDGETTAVVYQWYRLWNSGLLEHGGIIKCNPIVGSSTTAADAYVKVDLRGADRSNPVYNYDAIDVQGYGQQFDQLYYGTKAAIDWKEIVNTSSGFLGSSRYAISLTPTIFNANDISKTSFKYNDISCLSAYSYPEVPAANKNSTYLVNEVHRIKNDSFCFTRSDTDTFAADKVQYYQYYTIGYKSNWRKYDFDLDNVTVANLQPTYAYTGSEIKPPIVIMNVYQKPLANGTDYVTTYSNNINRGVGTIVITGKGRYFNQRVCKFTII